MQDNNFNFREQPEYGEFAKNVDAYFASPQSVFFGGEHVVIDGGIAIVQHVDRYVFAGVKRTKAGKPRVKRTIMHVPTLPDHWNSIPHGYDFETENLSHKQLEKIIAAACQRFNFEPRIEIHLLTEGFAASGANTSGAVAATVSACLFWASEIMSKEEFENLAELSPEDIALTKANRNFQKELRDAKSDEIKNKFDLKQKVCLLNDLAWVIDAFSHGGKASGYGAIAGIVHSRQPFCFFPERRSPYPGFAFGPLRAIEDEELKCKDFDLGRGIADIHKVQKAFNIFFETISGISFSASKLNKLLPEDAVLRKTDALPFTWGVIHSGCTKNTAEKINNVEKLPWQRMEGYNSTHNIVREAGMFNMVPRSRTAFAFLGKIGKGHERTLRDPLRWEMIGLGTETLPAMRNAMENGKTEELAACMRKNEALLEAMGLNWYEGQLIADTIYQAVEKEDYDKTAVKLTGGGGGGCMIFIAPEGKGEIIKKNLQKLQSHLEKMDVVLIQDCSCPNFQFGAGLTFKPELVPSKPREDRPTKVIRLRSIRPHKKYGMVGSSPEMKNVYNLIDVIGPSDSDVLITGETGTGKEMIAKAIWKYSPRSLSE